MIRTLFVSLLIACATPALAKAQKASEDVLALFLDVPGEMLKLYNAKSGKPLTPAERKTLVKVNDAKNGWISLLGNELVEGVYTGEVAKFKKSDGTALLVVVIPFGDSTDDILALERRGKGWVDVTKEVLPQLSDELVNARAKALAPDMKKKNLNLTDSASGTYRYVLPRKGRTIEVIIDSDIHTGPRTVLFRLPFDGKKFNIAR